MTNIIKNSILILDHFISPKISLKLEQLGL